MCPPQRDNSVAAAKDPGLSLGGGHIVHRAPAFREAYVADVTAGGNPQVYAFCLPGPSLFTANVAAWFVIPD